MSDKSHAGNGLGEKTMGHAAAKTKPIRGVEIASSAVGLLAMTSAAGAYSLGPSPGGRETIVQNEPNFVPAADAGRKRLCKTKPNLGELRYVGRGGCHGVPGSPRSETCKTKPIGTVAE
jgi:hypothetical protein